MKEKMDDIIKKAQTMAGAEKPLRDLARPKNPMFPVEEAVRNDLDRQAEEKGEKAGELFDKKQEEKIPTEEAQHKTGEATAIPEMFRVEELTEAGVRLVNAFKRREDERLIPLIEPGEISALMSGFRNLEDGVQSKKIDEVDHALAIIIRALDSIGHAQRHSTQTREDDESLGKVIFLLKNLQDACLSVRSRTADNVALSSKLQRINAIAQSKWLYVAKKRDLVRAYLGR